MVRPVEEVDDGEPRHDPVGHGQNLGLRDRARPEAGLHVGMRFIE